MSISSIPSTLSQLAAGSGWARAGEGPEQQERAMHSLRALPSSCHQLLCRQLSPMARPPCSPPKTLPAGCEQPPRALPPAPRYAGGARCRRCPTPHAAARATRRRRRHRRWAGGPWSGATIALQHPGHLPLGCACRCSTTEGPRPACSRKWRQSALETAVLQAPEPARKLTAPRAHSAAHSAVQCVMAPAA